MDCLHNSATLRRLQGDGRGVQLGPDQLIARVGSIDEFCEGAGGGIDEGVLRLLKGVS